MYLREYLLPRLRKKFSQKSEVKDAVLKRLWQRVRQTCRPITAAPAYTAACLNAICKSERATGVNFGDIQAY